MFKPPINRRQFLQYSAAGLVAAPLAAGVVSGQLPAGKTSPAESPWGSLPRFRGFNVTDKLREFSKGPFREKDFEWIASFGFNFARLPMDYRCWTDTDDMRTLDEKELKEVDNAVEYGRQHGVHINLNLHRIPGHEISGSDKEQFSLWDRGEALDHAAFQWTNLAERYKDIPNERLSFNLLNEPLWFVTEEVYTEVILRLLEAVRTVDPARLIVVDGLQAGKRPLPSMTPLGVAQAFHSYEPLHVSHWKASWVEFWIEDFTSWMEPAWPLTDHNGKYWDKDVLRQEFRPWRELSEGGCRVQVGEFGVYDHTPHAVALAYLEDQLALFQEAGWDWALGGFREEFGILDPRRQDISYEPFNGHRLDRALLELLQRY